MILYCGKQIQGSDRLDLAAFNSAIKKGFEGWERQVICLAGACLSRMDNSTLLNCIKYSDKVGAGSE